ncbi:MAG TPA: acyloxyacyl hydrolase [Gallionella sp.]|nr:acyloxyacyl hydrolase [Gallionella sp.]
MKMKLGWLISALLFSGNLYALGSVSVEYGSALQFGDHLGAGVRLGEHQQFDLALRFQHLSNGDIKQPNHGINLNQVRFASHF